MIITLINPPTKPFMPASFFPLGLGYIAAVLKNNKYEVKVLDFNANRPTDKEIEMQIKNDVADVYGITAMAIQYNYVKWLSGIIRKHHPGKKIILGGKINSGIPEFLLQKGIADILILGEGEKTILKILSRLERGMDLSDTQGIAFSNNGRITYDVKNEFFYNLDEIPLPAYEIFPVEKYIDNVCETSAHRGSRGRKSINVISSRGCPFACNFCSEDRENFRGRSIDSVIYEMKYLIEQYKVQHIHFSDGLFFSSRKKIYEFCDAIKRERINISWSGNGRVDIVDEKLLVAAKNAGCNHVGYGFESGSQEMLKAMNKTVTVQQAVNTAAIHKKIGLSLSSSIILGAPGENKKTLKDTEKFCKKVCLYASSYNFITPFPGTPLYGYAREIGKIIDEEKYLEKLSNHLNESRAVMTSLVVNFTDFTDDQLIKYQKKLSKSVHRYVWISRVINAVSNCYKTGGAFYTLKKCWAFLSQYLTLPEANNN